MGPRLGKKRAGLHGDICATRSSVDEVLSLAAMKLISNKSVENSIRGKDLHQAENYVLRSVQNQALDLLRSERVRRHEDITELLHEPGSWESLGELIPEREQEASRKSWKTQ